ncbi:nuclease [[Actinobacillus] muris]|uniref:Nuclease n=1 Tax=Muribacter muris TaxID=67855 RepID=A0A0J5P8K5_9PAST|nr:nuclease [[Actinobacillus] muris] [Muribacter muris]
MLQRWRILIMSLGLGLFSAGSSAELRHLECQVVGISDGDTLTCLKDRKPLKIRLQYIDAPESTQPFGQRAKQALSALAFKKQVRVAVSGYDKYQRLLGVIYNERGENLNLMLVEQGMAWAYRQTQPNYQQAESLARQCRIGLWQAANPINPADWRANKRSDHAPILQHSRPNAPLAATLNCNVKRSCRQMADYNEALRYFQQCGWKELDGNNDGIPCNKLYRQANRK